MNNALGVTKVQSICNSEYNFSYLFFSRQAMQIADGVELSTFTILHHYVKVGRTVIDLVYFDYIGMFKLTRQISTNNMISHSFIYILRSLALIFFLDD
jgi:hypothetical protein